MNTLFAASTSTSPHFKVLGVPVRVETSFFIVLAMLAFSSREPWQMASWVAVSFVAILVHELGHALLARSFGHSVRIALHGMGGTAHHFGSPLSATKRVLVSLAGPFAGFALGAVFFFVPPFLPGHDSLVARVVISDVLWITLGYGVLNLLPILPLDGGQALLALLQKQWPARAERISDIVGIVVGVIVVGAAIWLRSFPLGFIIFWLVLSRVQQMRAAAVR